MLPPQPCELLSIAAGPLGGSLELLAIKAGLVDDGLELSFRPPRLLLRRLLTPLQVGNDQLGGSNLQGQLPGPRPLHIEALPEAPLQPDEIRFPPTTLLESLQSDVPSGTKQRGMMITNRKEQHTWLPGRTVLSKAPIAEDRAARAWARPPCTACHLCHSAASSRVKRCLGGSSRDDQRRMDPLHALGTVGAEAEAGAHPDAAIEVGTTTPEAARFADGSGACTPVAAEAAAGSPNGSAASDASGKIGIPAATLPSAAIAKGGSSAPAGAPRAGPSTSAIGVTSAGILEVEVPTSVATASSAAVVGASTPSSVGAAADPATAAGASVPPPVAVASSASSASSLGRDGGGGLRGSPGSALGRLLGAPGAGSWAAAGVGSEDPRGTLRAGSREEPRVDPWGAPLADHPWGASRAGSWEAPRTDPWGTSRVNSWGRFVPAPGRSPRALRNHGPGGRPLRFTPRGRLRAHLPDYKCARSEGGNQLLPLFIIFLIYILFIIVVVVVV
uniref:Uncharacterized protein n=1 Tax=Setaria viridis TaxID=4556 RepID=A0A4U6UAY0_SETVI|nr:hypothetical protein SEVIR_5G065300v2 [Setaria viridis]